MCDEVCELITLFLPFHSYPTGKCWNSLHFTSLTHFIPIGDLDTARRLPHGDGLATCVRVAAGIHAWLPLVSTTVEPQLPGARTTTPVDGSGPSLSATPYQGHPIVTRINLARPVSRTKAEALLYFTLYLARNYENKPVNNWFLNKRPLGYQPNMQFKR